MSICEVHHQMPRHDPDQEHGSTGACRKRTRVNYEDDIQNEDSDLKVGCSVAPSIAPLLHCSIAPLLHCSIAPLLRCSTAPLLHCSIAPHNFFFYRNEILRNISLHSPTLVHLTLKYGKKDKNLGCIRWNYAKENMTITML